MTQTMTLQVEGMMCTGCEQRIGTALRRIDGVRDVAADHTIGEVRVRFDPDATGRAAVLDRVALAGFEVRDEDAPGDRR